MVDPDFRSEEAKQQEALQTGKSVAGVGEVVGGKVTKTAAEIKAEVEAGTFEPDISKRKKKRPQVSVAPKVEPVAEPVKKTKPGPKVISTDPTKFFLEKARQEAIKKGKDFLVVRGKVITDKTARTKEEREALKDIKISQLRKADPTPEIITTQENGVTKITEIFTDSQGRELGRISRTEFKQPTSKTVSLQLTKEEKALLDNPFVSEEEKQKIIERSSVSVDTSAKVQPKPKETIPDKFGAEKITIAKPTSKFQDFLGVVETGIVETLTSGKARSFKEFGFFFRESLPFLKGTPEGIKETFEIERKIFGESSLAKVLIAGEEKALKKTTEALGKFSAFDEVTPTGSLFEQTLKREFEAGQITGEVGKSAVELALFQTGRQVIERPITTSVIVIGGSLIIGKGLAVAPKTTRALIGVGEVAQVVAQPTTERKLAAAGEFALFDIGVDRAFKLSGKFQSFKARRTGEPFLDPDAAKLFKKLVSEKPSKLVIEESFSLQRRDIPVEVPKQTLVKTGDLDIDIIKEDAFQIGRVVQDVPEPSVKTFKSFSDKGTLISGVITPEGTQFTTLRKKVGVDDFLIKTKVEPTGKRTSEIFKGEKLIGRTRDVVEPEFLIKQAETVFTGVKKLKTDDTILTELTTGKRAGIVSNVPRDLTKKTFQPKGFGDVLEVSKTKTRITEPATDIKVFKTISAEVDATIFKTKLVESDAIDVSSKLVIEETPEFRSVSKPAEFLTESIGKRKSVIEIEFEETPSVLAEKSVIKSKKGSSLIGLTPEKLLTQDVSIADIGFRSFKEEGKFFSAFPVVKVKGTGAVAPALFRKTKEVLVADVKEKTKTATLTTQQQILGVGTKQQLGLVVETDTLTKTKSLTKTKTLTDTVPITKLTSKLKQESKTLIDTLTKSKPTKPSTSFLPFGNIPIPKIPKLASTQGKRKEKPKFFTQIKVKGKFETLPNVFEDIAGAFKKGIGRVKTTAAASTRVVSGQGVVQKIPDVFKGLKGFRLSTKDEDVLVELKERRIKSFGELSDITFKGLRALKQKRREK